MKTPDPYVFHAILDYLHDGVIAVDSGGSITVYNKAAERITGVDRSAAIGKTAVEVIPNTRLHLILKSGEPELNQQQSVGSTVIFTSRLPVKDGQGAVVGAVAVFRDMTEIMALSEQVSDLWKSRTLLEAVIESSEDAISVADENGNNIIVNPAYTRITGLPRETVINKPVTIDIAEGESMHLKILRTGKPVRNIRMKVGPARKEVIVNVAPIFVDGKIRGSVGVIHDISEIMILTKELANAKKIIRLLEAHYTWTDMIGRSREIENAKEQARRAAVTPATVLLLGESGTGKELFAHAIHSASSRNKGRFVRVNCAAIAEDLLESELFGYTAGAFTGALKGGRKGLFEEASGGTIFLDEIGEISLGMQRKLLRVLQEKEIVRVGSTTPVPVDVRVITATNARLEQKVKAGSFREDLYYRLNVLPIDIPPLRKRKEDIPLIVEHLIFRLNQDFGREVKGISGEASGLLAEYSWPGNIRELENVLGRAMIRMRPQDRIIEAEHLPVLEPDKTGSTFPAPEFGTSRLLEEVLADAERNAIAKALKEAGGNREKTAALLGIALRNLYYKMKKYGLKERYYEK